ncbi:MAG: hypothetical protein N2Z80_06950 [Hydrogenothermaceae bacterium]|nr:hypothetical protein [Hydrogenothermaceae bacterium]
MDKEESVGLESLLDKYGLSYLKGRSVEDILEELVLLPPGKRPQEIVDYVDSLIVSPKQPALMDLIQKIEEETAQKMLEIVEEEIINRDLKENGTSESSEPTEPKKWRRFRNLKAKQSNRKKRLKKEEEERVLRIDVQKIENLINLVGELVLDRNRLIRTVAELTQNTPPNKYTEEIESIASSIDKIVEDLQLAVMKTRMQPVKRLFQKFSRVVRDLSKVVGKEVELIIQVKIQRWISPYLRGLKSLWSI